MSAFFWHIINLDLEWKLHKENIACFHLYLKGHVSQCYYRVDKYCKIEILL